ncbi:MULTISPECIES: diguanylate cyclase [unclassified Brenneria]|uniref:diguanylate cyclase n=1 Tax=unclassified Brenneria TaxID=2634434 RepID=UPI0015532D99|nr:MULTISPECIES: diguanylate cyclase [unclassified Brenneria]MBJ7222140.1 diguanylate cyclase [Brenneria sp. L3-3C-1]MEE3643383.1 diguanylate cyclase [Brenneria sp. L3_3C_1]MEE3651568.1 diguanylate cyclase [Brenneria sp. HEZEL_4_2_4]NPD01525.1 diguanylate cyclase [Brenneria sp. hezel4-2-4]
MTAVSAVALVTISLFIVIQLFHFVNQRREDYARQLEVIAYSVRQPLTEAVLQGEVQRAEDILNSLLPVGFLSRADVLLPDEFQTLHASFPTERPVPNWIAGFFKLPIQISVPLYSPPQTQNSTPLAHLVLQADSYRMFQFIVSTFSIMLATYLLLALVLSIAITWCMNRLMVHPLRAIITELQNLPAEAIPHHQLTLPEWHQDDELGVLVRSYNRNQQLLKQSLFSGAMQYDFPDKADFIMHLERWLAENTPFSLMVIGLAPLSADNGSQISATLINQLKAAVNEPPEERRVLLARLDNDEFAVLGKPLASVEQAQAWARNVIMQINAPFISLNDNASPLTACVGILHVDASPGKQTTHAALFLSQARLAMQRARHERKNGIHVFDE